MTLLQPETEQRLQTVGHDAQVAAGRHQLTPQFDGVGDRVVQLEAGLAGERQAHDVAGHAGNVGVAVLQELRGFVDADPTEQLTGERTGDVDRAE